MGYLESRSGCEDEQVDIATSTCTVGAGAEDLDGVRRDPIDGRRERRCFDIVHPHEPRRTQRPKGPLERGGRLDWKGNAEPHNWIKNRPNLV